MKTVIAIVVIALAALVGYWILLPKTFVTVGRRAVTAQRISIERVTVERSVTSYNNERVDADPGKKFVTFDLRLAIRGTEFDVYDIQLVKEKKDRVGTEENVGDSSEDNYFFWTPLDSSGQPAAALDLESPDTRVRVSFQVPNAATAGFLLYWGVYLGPFEFAAI